MGRIVHAVAAEADTLASVTGRGATSSVAVTFFGGVTSSNLNVSGTSNLATINASSVAISGGLTAATSSITGHLLDQCHWYQYHGYQCILCELRRYDGFI
jgi:hypothetical protein